MANWWDNYEPPSNSVEKESPSQTSSENWWDNYEPPSQEAVPVSQATQPSSEPVDDGNFLSNLFHKRIELTPEQSLKVDELKRKKMMEIDPAYTESQMMRGLYRGSESLKGLWLDTIPMMISQATGDEENYLENMAEYQARSEVAAKAYGSKFESVRDAIAQAKDPLEVANNLLEQASYLTGSALMSNAPSLVAGAFASALTGPATLASGALAVGKTFVKRSAAFLGASGVVNATQTVPDSYMDILENTGVGSPAAAIAAGSINAYVENLPIKKLLNTLVPDNLKNKVTNEISSTILKNALHKSKGSLVKEAVQIGALEGLEEGTQSAVNMLASKLVDSEYELMTKENLDKIIDSSIDGAVGGVGYGGTVGGVLKTAGWLRYRNADKNDVTQDTLEEAEEQGPSVEQVSQELTEEQESIASGKEEIASTMNKSWKEVEGKDLQEVAPEEDIIKETQKIKEAENFVDEKVSEKKPDSKKEENIAGFSSFQNMIDVMRKDFNVLTNILPDQEIQVYRAKAERNYDTSLPTPTGKGLLGVKTFEIDSKDQKGINVPVSVLQKLTGIKNEKVFNESDPSLSAKDILEASDNLEDAIKPIKIKVNHKGEAFISAGINRVSRAVLRGDSSVPVKIEYLNGGERAQGQLSPEKVYNASKGVEVQQSPDAFIEEKSPDFLQSPVSRELGVLKTTDQAIANNIPKIIDTVVSSMFPNKTNIYSKINPETMEQLTVSEIKEVISNPDLVSPEVRAHVGNFISSAIDFHQKSAEFLEDSLAIESLFDFFSSLDSDFLTEADRKALTSAEKTLIQNISETEGIDPNDLLVGGATNVPFSENSIYSFSFYKFLRQKYGADKGVKNNFGSAERVFNKIAVTLHRTADALKANSVSSTEQVITVPNKNITRALREMESAKIKAYSERVMGDQMLASSTELLERLSNMDADKMSKVDNMTLYQLFFGTMPYIASTNPYMADIVAIARNKVDAISSISKDIGTPVNEIIVKRPQSFKLACDLMSLCRDNGIKAKIVEDQGVRKLRYINKDGKYAYISNQTVIDDFLTIRRTMEKIFDLQEGSIRKLLRKDYGIREGITPAEMVAEADAALTKAEQLQSLDTALASNLKEKSRVLLEASEMLKNMQEARKKDYVPHIRYGDKVVMVFRKIPEGQDTRKMTRIERKQAQEEKVANIELVFLQTVEENGNGSIDKLQEENLQKILREKYSDTSQYIIKGGDPSDRKRLSDNETLEDINSSALGMEMVYAYLEQNKGGKAKAVRDFIKKKLAESKLAPYKRPSKNIAGYSNDWPRVMQTYLHGVASTEVNLRFQEDIAKGTTYISQLNEKGKISPRQKIEADKYIEFVSNEETDWNIMRNIQFTLGMGFNPSSAFLQLVNGPTTNVALLGRVRGGFMKHLGNSVTNLKKAAQIFQKAQKLGVTDYTQPGLWEEFVKKGLISQGVAEDAKQISRSSFVESIIEADIAPDEESRSFKGAWKTTLRNFNRLAGVFVSSAEQVSRIATIITFSNELQKKGALQQFKETYEQDPGYLAFRRTNPQYTERQALIHYMGTESHGLYGKAGRGNLQRGALGSIIFPFFTHQLTQTENMIKLANIPGITIERGKVKVVKSKAPRSNYGKAALTYLLLANLVTAGVYSLPFAASAKLIYNLANIIYRSLSADPVEARNADIDLRKSLSDLIGPDNAEIITKGLLSQFTGIDFSGRIGIMTPFDGVAKWGSLIEAAMSERPVDIVSNLGPAGSATSSLLSGSGVFSGFSGVTNFYKAIGPYGEGALSGTQTKRGKQLAPAQVDGKATYSLSDRIKKSLGAMPMKESRIKEMYFRQRFEDTANNPTTKKLRQTAAEFVVKARYYNKQGDKALANYYMDKYNSVSQQYMMFKTDLAKKGLSAPPNAKTWRSSINQAVEQIEKGAIYSPKSKTQQRRVPDLLEEYNLAEDEEEEVISNEIIEGFE